MTNKKRKQTNRELLECIDSKIGKLDGRMDRLDAKNDKVNSRVDGIYGRMLDVSGVIDDLRTDLNTQFDNHWTEIKDKMKASNKLIIKGGLALTGLIIVAVGLNNVEAVVKIVTACIRWF